MDEATDRVIQSLHARVAAHEFVIEFLLRAEFGRLATADRHALADWLLAASKETEAFHGKSPDDFHAVRISDLLIDMQGDIVGMVNRALKAVDDAEARL